MGGFAGAIICCIIYGAVIRYFFGMQVNYAYLAVYGALGSVVAQLGDLSFSYIKRQYGLKDFATSSPATAACWTGSTA